MTTFACSKCRTTLPPVSNWKHTQQTRINGGDRMHSGSSSVCLSYVTFFLFYSGRSTTTALYSHMRKSSLSKQKKQPTIYWWKINYKRNKVPSYERLYTTSKLCAAFSRFIDGSKKQACPTATPQVVQLTSFLCHV